MMTRRHATPAVALFGAVVFAVGELASAGAAAAVQDPEAPSDPVWSFLAQKYDKDGDGSVTPEEHGRGDKSFGRLDKNSDGVLNGEDFASSPGGGRAGSRGGGRMLSMMAPSILMRMFDQDGEDDLSREELEQAAKSFDVDGDAKINAEEWKAATKDKNAEGRRLPMDPFDVLVEVSDEDKDGTLAIAELLAFFDKSDSDSNGVLASRRSGGRGPGSGGARGSRGAREEEETVDDSPSAVGKVAPDFTLRPPAGGNDTTLSSWTGKRPVALIFGSYT